MSIGQSQSTETEIDLSTGTGQIRIHEALLAVADRPPEIEAARSLAAQRDFLTYENTRSKNRLRSILLESCPEFEAQADLSDPATLELMAVARKRLEAIYAIMGDKVPYAA